MEADYKEGLSRFGKQKIKVGCHLAGLGFNPKFKDYHWLAIQERWQADIEKSHHRMQVFPERGRER